MPYNYLLQPGICKGTTVLKFGLSYKDDRSRILSYGKKTFFYYEIDTINPKLVEDYLKKEFNKKFELHDGQEYFKGDVVAMCETFLNICEKYKNMKYDTSIEVEQRECHKKKMKLTFHKINTMIELSSNDYYEYQLKRFNEEPLFQRSNIMKNTKCYPYITFEGWRDTEWPEFIKNIYIIDKKKRTGCFTTYDNQLRPFQAIGDAETLEGWVCHRGGRTNWSYVVSEDGEGLCLKRNHFMMDDGNMYTYDYMNERETNRLVINDIIKKAHKAYTKLPSNKRDIIKKHSKSGIAGGMGGEKIYI